MSKLEDKIIILVSPTGKTMPREGGPYVPISPQEIAEDVYRCYNAGASMLHIHARDVKTKLHTIDMSVYREIFKRIREKCNILIQTTNIMGVTYDPTGKRADVPTDDQRLALLSIEPRQDCLSMAMGTWDFYHPVGGYTNWFTFVNGHDSVKRNIEAAVEKKFPFEMEVVNMAGLFNTYALAEEGVFDKNARYFWVDYCLGFGAMPAKASVLNFMLGEGKQLFPQARWEINATGIDQLRMGALAASMGCNIWRTGFEDNIYLPNGEIAKYNVQIVESAVKIAKDLGREIATVDEAKQIMGFPK